MLTDALYAATGWAPSWCRDLCAYYQVRPSKALALGTRATGRRPFLPGSPTCQPVSGKTWEDLWTASLRDTPDARDAFWREIGAWCVFRQAVRHRGRSFRFVLRRLRSWDSILEYGAGIAPVCWWLVRHAPWPLRLTIADVESEHLTFGLWRLRNHLVRHGDPITEVHRLYVQSAQQPIMMGMYRVATILETLEHLTNPLDTIEHLDKHLQPGGWLFEDFTPHGDAHAADLPQAQTERPGVYAYVCRRYRLVAGRHWDAPDGGGVRTWRKC